MPRPEDTGRIPGRLAAGESAGGLSIALSRLAAAATEIEGVWEKDLVCGDWVLVKTRNSLYVLGALGDGSYLVTGGWFGSGDPDPRRVRISGCTWGGHAILTGIVAAPGMCLEFDNGVQTTRIQQVRLLRGADRVAH